MKKYLLTGGLLAAVAVAVLIGAQVWVNGMQDDVTYKETVLFGDKTWADGVKVKSKIAANRTRLYWDTDYEITSSDKIISDTRFHLGKPTDEINPDYVYFDANLYLDNSVSGEPKVSIPDQEPLHTMITDVASRTAVGKKHKEKLRLIDYTDTLPLQVTADTGRIVSGSLCTLKVPDSLWLSITIEKNPDGTIKSYSSSTKRNMISIYPVSAEDGYYLFIHAFNKLRPDNSEEEWFPVPENINGIHYVPYLPTSKKTEAKVLDIDSATLAYPLKHGSKAMGMEISKDGKAIYLMSAEKDKLCLSVIDKQTMKTIDKFFFGEQSLLNESNIRYHIVEKDNNLLLVPVNSDAKFFLLAKEDGKYRLRLTEKFWQQGFFPDSSTTAFDYDGKKLVIAANDRTITDTYQMDNTLFVYTKDGIKYIGKYVPSNTHHLTYNFDILDVDTHPLTVAIPK